MAPSRAFLASSCLAICAGCSSQSAAPFDRGQAATDAETFGNGERLDYPAAPYGSTVGATIQDFRFLGWKNPKDANYDEQHLDTIELAKFYNPSGASGGVKFLVITSTAVWCSACKLEYQDMASGKTDDYRTKGVEFMGALFEDNDSKPSDLTLWAKGYDVAFNFVLDPELKFGTFFDREATPMEMVIDAKNMQVLYIATGWATSGPGSLWALLDQYLAM
jgi:hypothetical protein